MKHFLTLSLLLSALAYTPARSSEESVSCEQNCFNADGELVGTIGAPLFTMHIGAMTVEIYSVEEDGTLHGIIPMNDNAFTIAAGDIIGTIGGETYRIASITPTENGKHFEIVLKV